jgi:hypothetical protein
MPIGTNKEIAALLRVAASQTIAESDFWDRFNWLCGDSRDPIAYLALETATHYWGNFHAINLLGFRRKPDPNQLQQGQDELNLIADGLEGDWSVFELQQKLDDV